MNVSHNFLIFFSSLCFWGSKPFGGWMRLVGHCGWASFVACKWACCCCWRRMDGTLLLSNLSEEEEEKVCFFLISRPFISQSSENRWLIYDRTDGLGECPCICHLHLFTTRQENKKTKNKKILVGNGIYKLRAISCNPNRFLPPLQPLGKNFFYILLFFLLALYFHRSKFLLLLHTFIANNFRNAHTRHAQIISNETWFAAIRSYMGSWEKIARNRRSAGHSPHINQFQSVIHIFKCWIQRAELLAHWCEKPPQKEKSKSNDAWISGIT